MTRLFQALLCQRLLHLLISRHRATIQEMVANSTLAVALQRAGTSTLTDGEQAALYSSTHWALGILTVAVAEPALLRTSASVAAIGLPALIPRPTVVT